MTTRQRPAAALLLLGAFVLLIAGLMLGITSHGDCGSAWSPAAEPFSVRVESTATGQPDQFYASCRQQLGSDGTLGAVLCALAGVSVVGALVLRSRGRRAVGEPQPVGVVELTPDGPRYVA